MDIGLLLLIQSIFDVFLLVLVLALYRQVRRLRELPLEETLARLKEANRLCDEMAKRLAQKSAPTSSSKETLKKRVLALAERGLSPEEIARELGLQEGEVALLLSMGEKRGRKWKA